MQPLCPKCKNELNLWKQENHVEEVKVKGKITPILNVVTYRYWECIYCNQYFRKEERRRLLEKLNQKGGKNAKSK